MLKKAKDLINLIVETEDGDNLGNVKDFDLDLDSFKISTFYIKPLGLVKGLISDSLIINIDSVISINEEKMIVNNLKEKEMVVEVAPIA